MTLTRHSKYVLLSWLIVAVLVIPELVFAQARGTTAPVTGDFLGNLKIGLITRNPSDIGGLIFSLVQLVLLLAGILAFFYVMYGGFLYLTAGGDTANTDKGRKTIVNALIGVIIISISYALVVFVADRTKNQFRDTSNNQIL